MNERQIDKLLVKISRGDNEAFAELYEATKGGVYSFLYSFLQNRDDTNDVLQTVYLKIKVNISKYRHGTNGRAWILQIAKNTALNEIYARKRTVNIDDVEISAQSPFTNGIDEVMKSVLTAEERQIIIMHVLWGFKHKEIAEQIGCPVGTVTSKYKRSIEKLKIALKEAEE